MGIAIRSLTLLKKKQMWLNDEIENIKKNHPWRWKWEGLKLDFGEWRHGKLMPTVKKVINIISDILKIGKTAAKGFQISGDASTAKRIKKAILNEDIDKLRKIVTRGGIYIDRTDIMGYTEHEGTPFVTVTAEFIVRYRQLFKEVRRYQRKGD